MMHFLKIKIHLNLEPAFNVLNLKSVDNINKIMTFGEV